METDVLLEVSHRTDKSLPLCYVLIAVWSPETQEEREEKSLQICETVLVFGGADWDRVTVDRNRARGYAINDSNWECSLAGRTTLSYSIPPRIAHCASF